MYGLYSLAYNHSSMHEHIHKFLSQSIKSVFGIKSNVSKPLLLEIILGVEPLKFTLAEARMAHYKATKKQQLDEQTEADDQLEEAKETLTAAKGRIKETLKLKMQLVI